MSKLHIDYQGPATAAAARRPVGGAIVAAFVLVAALIGLNAFLLSVATADQSWGALGIAIAYGPAANGMVLLVSLGGSLVVKWRLGWSWATVLLMVLSVVLPIAAAGVDFAYVGTLNLHGC